MLGGESPSIAVRVGEEKMGGDASNLSISFCCFVVFIVYSLKIPVR